MELRANRHQPGDPALANILTLIQTAFADMNGKIDPPSSMHQLTLGTLNQQAANGEIWSYGEPPLACVFLTPRQECLYLGKLAVASAARGQGLARRLIKLAEQRAHALQRSCIELQARVELADNHAVFEALGFREVGRTAHQGFDRPTSITYCKLLEHDS